MMKIKYTAMPDFREEISTIVRSNFAPAALGEKLGAYHEKDIALALESLNREARSRLLRALPEEMLPVVLEYAENRPECLGMLGIRQRARVLSQMDAALAAEVLAELSKEERSALLELMDEDTRRELQLIRSFDQEQIGSRMSTDFVAISDAASIKEAMSSLVRQAARTDNISMLYLVDSRGRFSGALTLKDLIIAREGTPLSQITTVSYPYLYATAAVEDCVSVFGDYSEVSIPVLSEDNRLIGVVTAQDFAEILGQELGEDYAKLGGLSSEEDLAEPVLRSVRKRMPWLCILLVLGLGVSATVGLFESIVAQLPVIMCFQSLILDMAGNVGTQSLAVAIRVLMDSQLGRKRKAKLVWKEARIGLANGLLLGALSFGVIGGYLYLLGNSMAFSFAVSGCLGVSMVLAMVVSALSGTVIPIFFQRLGIDPAVASGPLITTVNDLVAVITYYGLAWGILLNLLHLA